MYLYIYNYIKFRRPKITPGPPPLTHLFLFLMGLPGFIRDPWPPGVLGTPKTNWGPPGTGEYFGPLGLFVTPWTIWNPQAFLGHLGLIWEP